MASGYDIANQLTGGRLGHRLRALRAEGLSFERIAERIRNEFGIPCTGTTAQRWYRALDAEPTPLPRRRRKAS